MITNEFCNGCGYYHFVHGEHRGDCTAQDFVGTAPAREENTTMTENNWTWAWDVPLDGVRQLAARTFTPNLDKAFPVSEDRDKLLRHWTANDLRSSYGGGDVLVADAIEAAGVRTLGEFIEHRKDTTSTPLACDWPRDPADVCENGNCTHHAVDHNRAAERARPRTAASATGDLGSCRQCECDTWRPAPISIGRCMDCGDYYDEGREPECPYCGGR
jgi:hypothetical protein